MVKMANSEAGTFVICRGTFVPFRCTPICAGDPKHGGTLSLQVAGRGPAGGQRMLTVWPRSAGEFFAAVDRDLQHGPEGAAATLAPGDQQAAGRPDGGPSAVRGRGHSAGPGLDPADVHYVRTMARPKHRCSRCRPSHTPSAGARPGDRRFRVGRGGAPGSVRRRPGGSDRRSGMRRPTGYPRAGTAEARSTAPRRKREAVPPAPGCASPSRSRPR